MQETRFTPGKTDRDDPLEKEMAAPLQDSCLENSMDRGAWRAIVHGVTEQADMT